MIPKPTLLIAVAVYLTCTLDASAQTVVFNATRAELRCADSGNPKLHVLLDGSLKAFLDDVRYDQEGVRDCQGNTNPKECTKYKKIQRVLESALSHATYSESFYVLEVRSGRKQSLQNDFTIAEILYDESPRLALDFKAGSFPIGQDETFVLMANFSKLDEGAMKTNAHIVKVDITPSCQRAPAEVPKAPTNDPEVKDLTDFLVESSKSKDANIGASFGLKGSRSNHIYTHEIAIQLGRLHRLGLGGAYDIIPFFLDHKFARDEKSPKDNLKFGIKANHILLFDRYSSRGGRPERDLFNSLSTTVSGHIETDFLFSDQVNLIGSWRSGLPINIFDARSSAARITPFIGYEFGRVLKDEIVTTKNKFLSRGLFGVDVFVAPWRKEKINPFEIEINYIRRLLAREEPEYYVNADGDQVLGSFNRGPKDFVKGRLTFNYNDRFAPYFQYSYGKEPGRYILQNSVIEAGLKVYLKWEK